jgi:thiamine-monophosphate kinase
LPLPERELIERIRKLAGSFRPQELITGMGDDAAILRLPMRHELLVTTDLMLEGVHFRRDWSTPEAVGHRALTRGLSDIAAMGGEPFAAFLSLALPRTLPQAWVDAFMKGFLRLARKYQVVLAGGDTSASPAGLVADVIVAGRIPRGRAITRSGARVGDVIFVTGGLGASSARIRELRRSGSSKPQPMPMPEPRLPIGRWLREKRLPTAMIDLSDGLSTDLCHICEESGVGAAIMENAIPRAQGATLHDALHGGEDYELLFTASPRKRVPPAIAGVPVSPIGEIVRSPKREIRILSAGKWKPLAAAGWEHFR